MSATRFSAELTSVPVFMREAAAWQQLAQEAIEPNPFYEPSFLIAATNHLERPDTIILLVVRDAQRGNRPVGLFPLVWPRLRDGLLFGAISLYRNPYMSLATPLILADCFNEVLDEAFELLAAANGQADILHFPLTNFDRLFGQALEAYCTKRGLNRRQTHFFERAAIETTLPLADYEARIGQATRKSIRRKLKKLGEQGEVAFTTVRKDSPDARKTLDEFLMLELKGWKGARGTAMASKPQTRAFAISAFGTGAASPDYFFERLSLDDQPLAINLNLITQRVVYTIKTTYDEDFAAFSPGVLLDWNTLRYGTAGAGIARLDSCADAGHRIESLWLERERIGTQLLGVTEQVPVARLDRIEKGMRWVSKAIGQAKALRDRFSTVA